MQTFSTRCAAALATLVATATALNGIVAPANITANQDFKITFENANSDDYRVYLAASLAGSNGPTCYLINSTTLNTTLTLTIPPGVGPSADYYSIAIADLTTSQGATYSNRFNLSGANGNYSDYENDLQGSPFWSANDLPCKAYTCARQCAMDSYPEDLTEDEAYETMKECILGCDGVTVAPSQTAPALSAEATGATATGGEASGTEEADAATSSGAAAERSVVLASAAAVGFGALALLL